MIGWIARILLLAAAGVTGWFVSKDAPGFAVVQMMVATLLLAAAVALFVYWPSRWRRRE